MTDDHPVIPWLNAHRRAWLYRVLLAVAAVAVIYGAATETEAAAWVALVAALIGTGTATVNTTTKD